VAPLADEDEHEREIRAYRERRLAKLTSESGWLTLVARYPLFEGANELPIGVATLEGGRVRIAIAPEMEVTCGGARVIGEREVRSDEPGPADVLVHGSLRYELVQRGDAIWFRVRDPESAARRALRSIPAYPIDARWRVDARFERPRPAHESVHFDYTLGPAVDRPSAGELVFELEGAERRLEVTIEDGQLFVLFGDQTNRDTTYPIGRFFYVPIPSGEGERVILDFNKALNPACAFTDHASCPVVPADNKLALRIEAGEMRP